ncbi:30S ribosomal protein S20 [Candidatus Peregrinibacteria bacterium]|nr:30S ribosomal protein S20 [Candidatus Peregrinibacteria bacterium]
MPIIVSAMKRVRQAKKKTERNHQFLSRMRSFMKNILNLAKSGETKKASALLPETLKAIDMAEKKNLIHKNNASRKKSLVSRAVNESGVKKKDEEALKA